MRGHQAGIDKLRRVEAEAGGEVPRADAGDRLVRGDAQEFPQGVGNGRRHSAGGQANEAVVELAPPSAAERRYVLEMVRQ